VDSAGVRALPIVGLLTFLIGVVLAYQLGVQLKNYGANIFVVYLSGTAILREFGPLITAIIVAGRTSSAFTAQIGMMKVNQEIDAMLTMGLSPVDRLVMPRIIGMLIAFPFLIFWSDVLGVMGSMMMAKSHLGVGYIPFLENFRQTVSTNSFWIGMSKAPVFALIIATVGCYQGFEVSSSADSVGRKTTESVVLSIFLIILADAAFSIIYSTLGI
jgi:phospholipid/cholesterol/gamma-HCH transport system permease protein